MIRGIHGLFYSSDAAATRAFIRDKLKFPFTDTGEGWLIFDLPEGDLGVHPIGDGADSEAGTHDISFFCDDIQGTVAELRAHGVRFKGEIADHGYGFVTYFTMPGGVEVQLYEPKYQKRAGRSKPATKGGVATKPGRRKSAVKRRRTHR